MHSSCYAPVSHSNILHILGNKALGYLRDRFHSVRLLYMDKATRSISYTNNKLKLNYVVHSEAKCCAW